MKNKFFQIFIVIILILLSGVIGYSINNNYHQSPINENTMNSTINNTIDVPKTNNYKTFYATIETINNSTLLVNGLSSNDINHRGTFTFTLEKDYTILKWNNTNINISDFSEGDTISITYSGEVNETIPGQILDVIKIELLNDTL